MTPAVVSDPPSEDLGPVLDTGATKHGIAFMIGIVGVCLLVFGGLMLIQNEATRPPLGVAAGSLAAGVVATAIAAVKIWSRRGVLTLHEKGLRHASAARRSPCGSPRPTRSAISRPEFMSITCTPGRTRSSALKSDGPDGRFVHFEREFRDPNETQGPSPPHGWPSR